MFCCVLLSPFAPIQLAEAQQQLAALSTHIDALMVGFAVQALQAAADPARQQAIHTQALAEQQKVSSSRGARGGG